MNDPYERTTSSLSVYSTIQEVYTIEESVHCLELHLKKIRSFIPFQDFHDS